MIIPYKNHVPNIHKNCFIAPSADIIGQVSIGEEVGIWFNCVLRGDIESITIGSKTNIQDGTVIHVTRNGGPTIIGAGVTVGHKAMLHGCTLQDHAFVGMGSIILDEAIVKSFGMLAAGAVLTPRKCVSSGEIWAGNPARFFRKMTAAEIACVEKSRDNYVAHVHEYQDISLHLRV